MYNYTYDESTGGILLSSECSVFSKEPRPVYASELTLFGFDKYWSYSNDDSVPYMWAESANYIYRGKKVARLNGGSLYEAPEIVLTPDGESITELIPIDLNSMVRKNASLLNALVNDTIKRVYSIYLEYSNCVDLFYVAFSGGKDSVVALDIVQRSIPHDEFVVLFGDTRMESPDTYQSVQNAKDFCKKSNIRFFVTDRCPSPNDTWPIFGPPSNSMRWCCTVHKTVPQILKLREITGKEDFLGFAFTGVRGDESASRSSYDFLNLGEKHKGQYSYHTILNWGSAELFLYMFSNGIDVPVAYKKGNSRVGCLMCPMSPSKHDFVKNQLYPKEMNNLVQLIQSTYNFGKKSEEEQLEQIGAGYWKSRRSGTLLNLGKDVHKIVPYKDRTEIHIYSELSDNWKSWCQTLGTLIDNLDGTYSIIFKNKLYNFSVKEKSGHTVVTIDHVENSRDQIDFTSYLKTIFIKTLYCVQCGACSVNCRNGQIKFENGKVTIGPDCLHCLKCHDNHDRCVCYNSKRNTLFEGNVMKGINSYTDFGFRKEWMDSYLKYLDDFWTEDDNLGNNMLKAFCKVLDDADLTIIKKGPEFDTYSKHRATPLANKLHEIGSDSLITWGIIFTNLCYHPQFKWYVTSINPGEIYTRDRMYSMLEQVVDGDQNGRMKEQVISSIKNILIRTPIGTELGIGICDYTEKSRAIYFQSLQRSTWLNPEELVILYGLYRLAASSEQYQFTLSDLCSRDVFPLSPACIFNLNPGVMRGIIVGLSNKYPDYISSSFTSDLEVVTLKDNMSCSDIINMIR